MALDSMQEIFERAEAEAIPFWRVVLETDMEERQVTEAQSWEKMRQTWEAMLESAVSYRAEQRSRSGLVGGDGARMRAYAASGKAYSGDYVQEVIATALSVGECNACMRKIVAAPTAGLHFTPELIEGMKARGFGFEEVTLHVGAGTFLPVKDEDAAKHPMHTEHFEVRRATVVALLAKLGAVTAVGTTSVRTLESLPALAWRIHTGVPIDGPGPVGQWELYDIPADYTGRDALEELLAYMDAKGLDRIKAATQIMIAPLGYEFRIVRNIITNFHQPKSTLLLLVSAFAGEDWRRIYDYALSHDFRFLSYGDSSVLMR